MNQANRSTSSNKEQPKLHKFRAVVARIFPMKFNSGNGYVICEITANNRTIVAKGIMPDCRQGCMYNFSAYKRFDPVRRKEYMDIVSSEQIHDATPYGIISYLKSECPGIGQATAEEIVAKYDLNALKVLSEEPERVSAEIRSLSIGKALKVQAFLRSERDSIDVKRDLHSIGITPGCISKLLKEWGADTRRKLKENCFDVIDIAGVGFKTACKIADMMGVPRHDPGRIQACIIYTLSTFEDKGHVCIQKSKLVNDVVESLKISKQLVEAQITTLLRQKKIASEHSNPDDFMEVEESRQFETDDDAINEAFNHYKTDDNTRQQLSDEDQMLMEDQTRHLK